MDKSTGRKNQMYIPGYLPFAQNDFPSGNTPDEMVVGLPGISGHPCDPVKKPLPNAIPPGPPAYVALAEN